ncbi:MAG: hypothetical protein ORN98_04635, partial [Alphaproteobacteria bacterium]|nr:hypothetical protein [Alphaproteobacteria bacterium]
MPKKSEKRNEKTSFSSDGVKSMGYATREDIQREHKELRSFMLAGIGAILAGVGLIFGVFYFAINAQFKATDQKIDGINQRIDIVAKVTDQKIDAINQRIDGID